MKKLISMVSALTLGVTGINSVVLANQYRNNSNLEISGNEINWNKMEESLLTMFDGILDESSENKDMILKAREESLKYYDDVKSNNLSLEEINISLSEMTKKYENTYGSEINNLRNSDKVNNVSYNSFNYFSKSKNIESLEEAKASLTKFSRDLAIAQNTLSSLAVVAGIAAAGFWAAAWWFGISIPWAVAASATSASLGVASASIGFYRQKHNLDPNLLSSVAWALNIRTIASAFKEIVYPVLIITETTVTASSWAVPAAFAAVGAIFVIYAWVSEFA
ncbi:hypothetical protein [Spiroplasma endosymbiont of Cantharis nigra]|uniref:hypothetical protein n=1 Tax=Spiroplasma endosymbiont of Cantharis nigra TaxID=3066278 RepID=UPI0030CEE5EB